MKVLFIHRSVGQQLVDCLRARQDFTFDLYDLNANTNTMIGAQGLSIESSLVVREGDTSPAGLAAFFGTASKSRDVRTELETFDVIAFKSCYSASALASEDALTEQMAAYGGQIADYISAAPMRQFLIVSPPPRRRLMTTKANAARAARFATWLEGFAGDRANCSFFDLFGALSKAETLSPRYTRLLPFDQHPNDAGAAMASERLLVSLSALADIS